MTREWHPYAETFPLLQGEEYEALKNSIQEFGENLVPILYRVLDPGQPGERRQYLDGRNRARACAELGITADENRAIVPDDLVERFIADINDKRRHQSPAERQQRVAALTTAGLSSRTIAATLGVSHATVQRDQHALEDAPGTCVPGESAPPKPRTVVGTNGKIYPADHQQAARVKNGQELFPWKDFEAAVGQLVRYVDQLGRITGLVKLDRRGCALAEVPVLEALRGLLQSPEGFASMFKDCFDSFAPNGARAPRGPARR